MKLKFFLPIIAVALLVFGTGQTTSASVKSQLTLAPDSLVFEIDPSFSWPAKLVLRSDHTFTYWAVPDDNTTKSISAQGTWEIMGAVLNLKEVKTEVVDLSNIMTIEVVTQFRMVGQNLLLVKQTLTDRHTITAEKMTTKGAWNTISKDKKEAPTLKGQ